MTLLVPLLSVIAIWWIGTGIVLYLQQRLEGSRVTLGVALVGLALASFAGMSLNANGLSSAESYIGFTSAVVLWGCIELSYYTGLIAGTHRLPCPVNCSTAERFKLALQASLWHELSILFAGILLTLLLWNSVNPVGIYTFMVLWLMRWSAKLNLFFGVPNFSTEWFPERLSYVHTYIKRGPVTLFYFMSVACASVMAWQLIDHALTQPSQLSLVTGLPGALLILAILEHVFMALPIADTELWNRIFARDDADASPQGQSRLDKQPPIAESTRPVPAAAVTVRLPLVHDCVKASTPNSITP
jgi:putative photosynthetic complex assembly protein 2